jgi:hypothetical protein
MNDGTAGLCVEQREYGTEVKAKCGTVRIWDVSEGISAEERKKRIKDGTARRN